MHLFDEREVLLLEKFIWLASAKNQIFQEQASCWFFHPQSKYFDLGCALNKYFLNNSLMSIRL